ncbi:single-stranded DNA-binding protein [Paraflavitalea soli]|uniref:Single-stranded DNA-binding protein n=1 Tax=Paraflavitalea soli TaxID=2315862 RepID=A0A3B7MIF8_9BACT|nr:single-stranded DNA-binding protein [Paraflavitalea soli]AXY73367.1 single-stranded DNA-binding protein [Paraflavitalea soli]
MYTLKNKVQLIGQIGSKPEARVTSTGKKWARLSLGSKVTYWNTAGKRTTEMQWHTLIAWGDLAELVKKYAVKGKNIAIEGKLINRDYIDKQGILRNVTEIILFNVELLKA